MQVNLTGFMDSYGAAAFMSELWKLLLSAQNTVGGVPAEVSTFCFPENMLMYSLLRRRRQSWRKLRGRDDLHLVRLVHLVELKLRILSVEGYVDSFPRLR